jgi:hypothetical protein
VPQLGDWVSCSYAGDSAKKEQIGNGRYREDKESDPDRTKGEVTPERISLTVSQAQVAAGEARRLLSMSARRIAIVRSRAAAGEDCRPARVGAGH